MDPSIPEAALILGREDYEYCEEVVGILSDLINHWHIKTAQAYSRYFLL